MNFHMLKSQAKNL